MDEVATLREKLARDLSLDSVTPNVYYQSGIIARIADGSSYPVDDAACKHLHRTRSRAQACAVYRNATEDSPVYVPYRVEYDFDICAPRLLAEAVDLC